MSAGNVAGPAAVAGCSKSGAARARADAAARDASQRRDAALLARVAARDTVSFGELYERHVGSARALARRLCVDDGRAEDVVQEAFISLWVGARRYRAERGSVWCWLASIVRNRAIDAWRYDAARPAVMPLRDDVRGELLSALGIDTRVLQRTVVRTLIAELPGPQREAVFLSYFAGMTQDEIAAHAGAPVGTIKARLRLGRQKIGAGLVQQAHAQRPRPDGRLAAPQAAQRARRRPPRAAARGVGTLAASE